MATCREIITSNDYLDYIVDSNDEIVQEAGQNPDVCVKVIDDVWSVGYGKLPAGTKMTVGELGYYTIPKLYGLMDTTSFDDSGITTTINQPSLNVRGQGVLIGFIDTGIDYLLDSFKFTPSSTRIMAIWDQSLELPQTPATGSTGSVQPETAIPSEGGTESGTQSETESGTQSETQSGTQSGTESGTQSGMQSGTESGTQSEIGNRTGAGTTSDSSSESTIARIQRRLEQEFDYGKIYTEEDINKALQAQRNGDNPYAVVASTDTNGHGTFMAGVAAASRTDTYIGAAPDSRIAMVKLKSAKQYLRDFYLIKDDAIAYQENDIMLGVRFLQELAVGLDMPLVICLGLGTSSGSRTGSSPLTSVLSGVARQGNNVVVTCVGNEANERAHVMGNVSSGTEPEEIEISVGSNEKGFFMEIWADSLDVLSVAIVSPSGEQIPRIPARMGNSSEFKFLLENTSVTVDYKVAEKTTGYEVVFIRFVTPSEGIWKINIYSLTNIKGGYNAWLPIRQFISSDTFFLDSTPNATLTGPSDAIRPLSIGAYDHISGGVYIESGRGYTPDNRVKPDIVAPGVNVYGPKAGGGFTNRTGTSIAAAHVAGAAALLLTWGVYYQNSMLMGTSEVKSILIRGATRDMQMEYPNNIWGYGKLNLIKSFLQMRIT